MHDSLTVSFSSLVSLTSLPSSCDGRLDQRSESCCRQDSATSSAKLEEATPRAATESAQKAAMLCLIMLGLSWWFLGWFRWCQVLARAVASKPSASGQEKKLNNFPAVCCQVLGVVGLHIPLCRTCISRRRRKIPRKVFSRDESSRVFSLGPTLGLKITKEVLLFLFTVRRRSPTSISTEFKPLPPGISAAREETPGRNSWSGCGCRE